MLKALVLCLAATAGMYLFVQVSTGQMNGYQAAATLMRPAAFVLMVLAGWGAVKLVQRLYRGARGITVETVGRTAGSLAASAADKRARMSKAFKTTRDA